MAEAQDRHAHHPARAGGGLAETADRVRDPVCGMMVDPHTHAASASACRAHLLLLLRRMPEQVRGRSRQISCRHGSQAARAGAGGHRLYLPDASADPPGRPRLLPDLRHGARARARQPRQQRPIPSSSTCAAGSGSAGLLSHAGARARNGRPPHQSAHADRPEPGRTGCSSCSRRRSCCGRGWPFFVRGWQSVVTRNLNMFTLIAMGTGVAWLYSVVAIVLPGPVSAGVARARWRGRGLFRGRRRDHRAGAARPGAGVARARADLRRHPRAARSRAQDRAPSAHRRQRRGRLARRHRGRRPAAGAARREGAGRRRGVEGRSSLDESMVTGESMPVTKEMGAKVIAGTLNATGSFVMRAEKVGRDTMLSRIVQMVAAAQRSRAPIQRLADQVSGWFVPAVIAIAILAFAAWAAVRAAAALALWPGRGRHRADHRLPMRAWARHADVDHGRRRPRRPGRRADQECRGARAHGEGRYAGGRQDRHADRGQAEGRRGAAASRDRGERGVAAGGERGAGERASARAAIVAAARERGLAIAAVRTSIRRPGRARSASSTAAASPSAMPSS